MTHARVELAKRARGTCTSCTEAQEEIVPPNTKICQIYLSINIYTYIHTSHKDRISRKLNAAQIKSENSD